jgi:hypothetical protein
MDEINVTEEMIEAAKVELIARLKTPDQSDHLLLNEDIAAIYRVMRALEPCAS